MMAQSSKQSPPSMTLKGVELPGIAAVGTERPWAWLAAGWTDLWKVPGIGLTYGLVFTALAAIMVLGLTYLGLQAMILSLCGGFLLVGPFLAVGLYDVSRKLEAGKRPRLSESVTAMARAEGQLSFLGVILLILYLVWVEAALILFMLFMGPVALPPIEQFIPTLLYTSNGLGLLIVGTTVGAILAAIVFAISAVSIPLLLTTRIDAVTAMLTSIATCRKNIAPMTLWAILIAGIMALAILTIGLGFIIAFPLIGHATWHAFRELVPEPAIH